MKFHDETSGGIIAMDRYYGFCDSGGLAGSFDGYATSAEAVAVISAEFECSVGTTPDALGEQAICVLSGQEYVDKLRTIDNLSEYGHFV